MCAAYEYKYEYENGTMSSNCIIFHLLLLANDKIIEVKLRVNL